MCGVQALVLTSSKDRPVNPELGANWKDSVAARTRSHCFGRRRVCREADLMITPRLLRGWVGLGVRNEVLERSPIIYFVYRRSAQQHVTFGQSKSPRSILVSSSSPPADPHQTFCLIPRPHQRGGRILKGTTLQGKCGSSMSKVTILPFASLESLSLGLAILGVRPLFNHTTWILPNLPYKRVLV